jgi:hypothetical protein
MLARILRYWGLGRSARRVWSNRRTRASRRFAIVAREPSRAVPGHDARATMRIGSRWTKASGRRQDGRMAGYQLSWDRGHLKEA